MKVTNCIKYMDYYIPDNYIEVDNILSMHKTSTLLSGESFEKLSRNFKEKSGIKKVSIFGSEFNLTQKVSNMIEKLFIKTKVKSYEISYLVCGNHALMEGPVSTVHYIHKKYHLDNAVILPLNQLCTANILAMGLSESLLNKNRKEYMLIISARISHDMKSRYVGFTALGDGLSMVLIENNPGQINMTNWCAINNGISSYNRFGETVESQDLYQLQTHIIRNGVSFLQKSLKEIKVDINNFDIIIHPNTYYDVWSNIYSSLLKIEPQKFYLKNIACGGHINDVDLIRNTKDYIDKKESNKKDVKILIYGIDLVVGSLDINYYLLTLEVKDL